MSSVTGGGYDFARDTGYLKEKDNADYLMYLTPIVVWDNFKGLNELMNTMSTFQILPTVFTMYDLEMPQYFEFLRDLQQYSLGRSHHKVILDSEGGIKNEYNSQLEEVYHDMELLQYDYIYGKKYANKLFD